MSSLCCLFLDTFFALSFKNYSSPISIMCSEKEPCSTMMVEVGREGILVVIH